MLLTLVAPGGLLYAKGRTETYQVPDIKDDFCGVHINYQYCKCAFHNETPHCEAVGESSRSANDHVQGEYMSYVRQNIEQFANGCISASGIWNRSARSCTYCADDEINRDGTCVKSAGEEARLPDGPFNADCSIKENEFNRDWKKYSDFDERVTSPSYEVGQWNQTLDDIAGLVAEGHQLEYEMEVDRQFRSELRQYRAALVQNIRNNVTKAIIRLTWITYHTVKGGKGAGESYSKLWQGGPVVEKVGAALKVIQSGVPKGSKAEIDTSTTKGKVKAMAWNAALEALESVADPAAVAKQVVGDGTKAILDGAGVPSPDITEEEVGILRDQHATKLAVDELLADSYAVNAERRKRVLQIEKEVAEKYNSMQEWKGAEKERVKRSLEASCLAQLNDE